jgi:hypothetical protein
MRENFGTLAFGSPEHGGNYSPKSRHHRVHPSLENTWQRSRRELEVWTSRGDCIPNPRYAKSRHHQDHPSERDVWQPISISLTRDLKQSKDRLARTRDTRNREKITAVDQEAIWTVERPGDFWHFGNRECGGTNYPEVVICETLTQSGPLIEEGSDRQI